MQSLEVAENEEVNELNDEISFLEKELESINEKKNKIYLVAD